MRLRGWRRLVGVAALCGVLVAGCSAEADSGSEPSGSSAVAGSDSSSSGGEDAAASADSSAGDVGDGASAEAGQDASDGAGSEKDEGGSAESEGKVPAPDPNRPEAQKPKAPKKALHEDGIDAAEKVGTYFVNLYSYSYATGDVADWERLSDPGCKFCKNVSDDIKSLKRAGAVVEGGGTKVHSIDAGGPYEDNSYVVEFDVAFAEANAIRDDTVYARYNAARFRELRLVLQFAESRWAVVDTFPGESE